MKKYHKIQSVFKRDAKNNHKTFLLGEYSRPEFEYLKDNPLPAKLTHNWAGLTYINTVWQNKMVRGMLQSFMGSFTMI